MIKCICDLKHVEEVVGLLMHLGGEEVEGHTLREVLEVGVLLHVEDHAL